MLHDRLQPEQGKRRRSEFRPPVIALTGLDYAKLHEAAIRVRQVHGIACGWDPLTRLPDELLRRLIEETAARFGEKFTSVPRGFLKGLVDILDELKQSSPSLAIEILATGIEADRIEAVEREEAHLRDHA
jgi:hypothetical protein